MLLERYTVFDEMGQYDDATGTLVTFPRKANPQRASAHVHGHFDYLAGKLVLLFRLHGVLYLQINGRRMTMEDQSVTLSSAGPTRVFRVMSDGMIVLELAYDAPHIDPPLVDDPTAFVEEEHFDFGLFLANVLRDPDRKSRIYK